MIRSRLILLALPLAWAPSVAAQTIEIGGAFSDGVSINGYSSGVFVGNAQTYGMWAQVGSVGIGVPNGTALVGQTTSISGEGVHGYSSSSYGVHGWSSTSDGVFGEATADAKSGVYAVNANPLGYAGYFAGNVTVTGILSKSGGSFKIDHPLDPEHRYLRHSFVESPDMMNVYNGNVVLDNDGEAWVELPEWFQALNGEYRYQLTCIGGHAPVYVAEEIEDNRFKIAGGTPELKVSWQVTGVRRDPWAVAHRIPVEEWKPTTEAGTYLHPTEWGQPMSRDVEWVHHPDVMQRETEEIRGADSLVNPAASRDR